MKIKTISLTALILLLAGIFLVTGCKEEEMLVIPRPEPTMPLIDNQVLRQADLELSWAHAMPLSGGEMLRNFSIIEGRLYAVSSNNYLMSFDLKSTDPVYTWKLGSDEMKMCGLQKYNDELFSVISTELVIMEWREGTKRMSRKMAFGALCPPVRNDEFYYIAGADERIHVLRASNLVEFFNASANDGFHISAVNADNQSVIFATDGGTVISMQPDRRIQNWKFNAEGAVNSSVIRDNGQVIFSSKDAYIYALSESKGKLLWKYLTPALLKEPPVATDKFIYQAVDGQGLIAIDRNGGELAFQVPNGDALLSEYNGKAYIMTSRRNLIVMDTAKKKEVSRIELPMISRWTSNVESREICLADDYGRIVCVKPIDF